MTKYLEFKQVPFKGKTKRFEVISKNNGYSLGRISWYGAWRQYTFSPAFETIWNKDCLKDIQDFLENLMIERKMERNPKILEKIKMKPNHIDFDELEYEPDPNE